MSKRDVIEYLEDAYSFLQDPAIGKAIEEIKRLQKYRDMVLYIANDHYELSYEKAKWQRDHWRVECVKLRNQLEPEDGKL